MRCAEARECCHLRADGELPAARAAELDAHLSNCPECRTFARQMDCLIGGLDELRRASLNIPDVPHTAAMHRTARWMRGALAMAAVILLAISVGLLRRERHRPVMPSPPEAGVARTSEQYFESNIALTGRSAGQYLALAQKTSQINVHVVCLFPVVSVAADEGDGANGDPSAEPAGM